MQRKLIKILSFIIMILMLILCLSGTVFADWDANFDELNNGEIKKAGNMAMSGWASAINLVQIIGVGIAVIVLVVIGIQYMYASPDSKAEIKNKAINYVVGAIMIFSATGILQIVKMFIDGNVNS